MLIQSVSYNNKWHLSRDKCHLFLIYSWLLDVQHDN